LYRVSPQRVFTGQEDDGQAGAKPVIVDAWKVKPAVVRVTAPAESVGRCRIAK
jgi:hypothetical protein